MPVAMEELLEIMRMLRDPEYGCPWDRKQTFRTIVPHTLEEAYEVADTIEREDYDHLANELGDLLFQVVFYTQLGKEQGLFTFEDVVKEITQKILTRHPHVFPRATMASFGEQAGITAEQVAGNWEAIKQAERADKAVAEPSLLDDIPMSLPALSRAAKIQKRAARGGFDWPDITGVFDKLREEIAELEEAADGGSQAHIEEELGDVFFSLINLSRHLHVEPESCLREGNRKFERRFRALETHASAQGRALKDMTLAELETAWQSVKRDEN
jgi:ATP diphosphatase